MSEPLKGKKKEIIIDWFRQKWDLAEYDQPEKGEGFYLGKDVRSAVEYFKTSPGTCEMPDICNTFHKDSNVQCRTCEEIDECFQDVMGE